MLDFSAALDDDASTVEKAIWAEELREFVKRKGIFKGNLALIQAVISGRCSESMEDKLKLLGKYRRI
jgi:hypothetical protein